MKTRHVIKNEYSFSSFLMPCLLALFNPLNYSFWCSGFGLCHSFCLHTHICLLVMTEFQSGKIQNSRLAKNIHTENTIRIEYPTKDIALLKLMMRPSTLIENKCDFNVTYYTIYSSYQFKYRPDGCFH